MARPHSLTELLQDLVAIPSVNPQGHPGTEQTGEQAMAEYVGDYLRNLGAEVRLDFIEPGRPNLIATFPTEKPATAHLAYAPHLDTVSVSGMTISPFDPILRDGKLYGRGSTDTKGPMAAALWAVRDWAQSSARINSTTQWTFLALMGEEAGNDGAHALAKQGFSADLILVLEPTELAVVTAHKGALWLELSTTGVACHGSTPEKGRNAISAMRHVLEILEDKFIPSLSAKKHPKLGSSTLNIGTIHGGSKINIVPDACRIELDCRLIPGETAEQFQQELASFVRQEFPDFTLKLQRYSPPLNTDETNPWVQKIGQAARGFTTAPWFSDAAVLSRPNTPAVCVGPGSIAQAHVRDEYILLRDLESGYELFRQWMLPKQD